MASSVYDIRLWNCIITNNKFKSLKCVSIFQIVKINATAANQDDSVNEVFASAVQFGLDDSVVEVVDSGNYSSHNPNKECERQMKRFNAPHFGMFQVPANEMVSKNLSK